MVNGGRRAAADAEVGVNVGGERNRGEKGGRVIWCGGLMKNCSRVI